MNPATPFRRADHSPGRLAVKRRAIGDRDKLQFNAGSALDVYIQAESAGKDEEANWLPVAKAPFTLVMRLLAPLANVVSLSVCQTCLPAFAWGDKGR